ncbi:MAG: ribose-phosphate pyrophosphokinae [Mucilaginibacter sp.]|nr:ribose-phosphate pyrophosphokinae [Mucilaginibacter sp.]
MLQDVTIIDSDNYEALGISTMFFPGGEPHIKVPIFTGNVFLFLKLRTWNETTFASLLLEALQRQETIKKLQIFIPYFPAARQDKVADNKAALTLSIVTSMFNTTGIIINVFDVHSPVINEYIFSYNYLPIDLNITLRENVVGIISPDKGAVERATGFRNHFYPTAELIVCGKKRNPETGELSSGYSMPELTKEGHYIIVDDICDGGYTFKLLTNAFEEQSVAKNSTLELFVSHGIFSKGLDALPAKISHITTTNSFCKLESSERLTVLKLETLFDTIIGDSIA